MRARRFEPPAGDRRGEHLALLRAPPVRLRAVDAVEIAVEAEVFDDALRVDLSLRGGDEQPIAARAQLVERCGDAVVDLVLEYADRVVTLAVELEHPVGVVVAGEHGEALAQEGDRRSSRVRTRSGIGRSPPSSALSRRNASRVERWIPAAESVSVPSRSNRTAAASVISAARRYRPAGWGLREI